MPWWVPLTVKTGDDVQVMGQKIFAGPETLIMLSSSFILKEKVNMGHLMRV